VLGGYDAARFTLPKYHYAINPTTPLEVGVQSILVNTKTNAYSATLDTSGNSQNFVARIDSTLPYLWLPKAVCDRFETIFGLTYDATTDHYIVNDTMRQRNIDNNAKVMIKLADTVTSPNTSTITLPYAAFDLQASWPIYNTETNYFPLRRAPNGIHVLGRTFLQEAYLTVDYERNNFSVAQATFSAQGPASVIVPIYRPAFVTQTPNKKGLGTGVIAGIGAAGGVIFLLLVLLALFLWHRNKKRAEAARLAKEAEEEKNKTEVFPDLGTPMSDDERRRRGYSGSTALSSELDNTDRGLSELPSPDNRISGEYFGHRKTVSKETNVSELEVVHEIHELSAGAEGVMSRGTSQSLGPIREGAVEVFPTPSPGVGVSPMDGRSPGGSTLVESPNEEIERLAGRQ
jgi:Eukaryotic aspartyl protease